MLLKRACDALSGANRGTSLSLYDTAFTADSKVAALFAFGDDAFKGIFLHKLEVWDDTRLAQLGAEPCTFSTLKAAILIF